MRNNGVCSCWPFMSFKKGASNYRVTVPDSDSTMPHHYHPKPKHLTVPKSRYGRFSAANMVGPEIGRFSRVPQLVKALFFPKEDNSRLACPIAPKKKSTSTTYYLAIRAILCLLEPLCDSVTLVSQNSWTIISWVFWYRTQLEGWRLHMQSKLGLHQTSSHSIT